MTNHERGVREVYVIADQCTVIDNNGEVVPPDDYADILGDSESMSDEERVQARQEIIDGLIAREEAQMVDRQPDRAERESKRSKASGRLGQLATELAAVEQRYNDLINSDAYQEQVDDYDKQIDELGTNYPCNPPEPFLMRQATKMHRLMSDLKVKIGQLNNPENTDN